MEKPSIKQNEIDRALALLSEEVSSLHGFYVVYRDETPAEAATRLGAGARRLNKFEDDLRQLFLDCLRRCVDSSVEIPEPRVRWIDTDGGYKVPDHMHNRAQVQPCEICGESRAIEECHIVPREIGGGSLPRNILHLCPTHHKSFDKGVLAKEEWNRIDWRGRHSTAVSYAKEVMLERQKLHWDGDSVPHSMYYHSFPALTAWIQSKTGCATTDEWNRKRKFKKNQRTSWFFEDGSSDETTP